MNIPIIQLSVSGMKHSIIMALTEYEIGLSEEIKKAVEACCTPKNIQQVINQEVKRILDSIIREEVERFYRYGSGRRTIRDAAIAILEENQPDAQK